MTLPTRHLQRKVREQLLLRQTSFLICLVIAAVSILSSALLSGCATEFSGDAPEGTRLEYPVGLAVHPNGRYLYTVSANFDLLYRIADGGSLSVIDLESGELVKGASKQLASFGSQIVLNHDASRGYIAVRGDSSITWFTLSEDGSQVRCPLADIDDPSLNRCRFSITGEPTSIAYSRDRRIQTIVDSNGVAQVDAAGEPLTLTFEYDLLAISHLSGGVVTMATVGDSPDGGAPAFSSAAASVLEFPGGIVHQKGTDRFFVSGRADTRVIGLRAAIGPDARVLGVFQDTTLAVPTPFAGYEGRSLLFSPDGDRLFATNQAPNSLLVFDVSDSDDDSVSGSRNRLIEMIDLPSQPNAMQWVEREGFAPILYITCFNDDSVILVDPSIPAIVGRLPVGDGPFEIIQSPNGDARAYLTNFLEHTVSVIDTSVPDSPSEIGIIGGPDDVLDAQKFRADPLY